MATSPSERIVLLFCHGGSFNKESWAPIIRRLQSSSLLQNVHHEFVAIDWRYHGAKASKKEPATLYYEDGDRTAPRVEHPGKHWPKWAPQDLYETTQSLKTHDSQMARKTRIIGIGHSMGAATLMKVEITHPGTFAGLILFEPPCILGDMPMVAEREASMMVAITMAREEEWDTWDDVVRHFKTGKVYRRWHHESRDAFLRGGIIKPKAKAGTEKFRLAMPLIQEASLYCHEIMNFTVEDFAKAQCPVVFEYGSDTKLFNLHAVHEVVTAHPSTYSLAEPLDGTTHLTVVEDPENCAQRIATSLEKFPAFQRAREVASKL